MTKTYSWTIVSGICKCGHSWEDHHLSMILNPDCLKELPEDHPPYVPEECEFYGCNETGELDEHGNDHCQNYRDKDSL